MNDTVASFLALASLLAIGTTGLGALILLFKKKWRVAAVWAGFCSLSFVGLIVVARSIPVATSTVPQATASPEPTDAPKPIASPKKPKPRTRTVTHSPTPVAESSVAQYPLPSKICCGDFNAARIKFGDAAQASVPGLDAIPVFTDVASLDEYYRSADDKQCDEDCVRSTYLELKARGSIKLVDVGTAVMVLGDAQDPEAKDYPVCRVRVDGATGLVICVALGDYSPTQ